MFVPFSPDLNNNIDYSPGKIAADVQIMPPTFLICHSSTVKPCFCIIMAMSMVSTSAHLLYIQPSLKDKANLFWGPLNPDTQAASISWYKLLCILTNIL